jgi:hypothetical protein
MKRDVLEKVTASLVVVLITVFTFGLILIIANLMFEWHIFPPSIEKIIYFLAAASVVVSIGAAVINIMLNISRLAFFAEKIARHTLEANDKDPS